MQAERNTGRYETGRLLLLETARAIGLLATLAYALGV
jgi:hypothetical protein